MKSYTQALRILKEKIVYEKKLYIKSFKLVFL